MPGNIVYGSTGHSEFFQINDAVSGIGITGLLAGSIQPYFTRMGSFASGFPALNIPCTGNWIAGGFAEISGVFTRGLYRLDIPNEAWNIGAQTVAVNIYGTGIIAAPKEFRLSYINDQINTAGPTANQIAAVILNSGVSTFNVAASSVSIDWNRIVNPGAAVTLTNTITWTLTDKTGYSLTVTPPTANQVAAVMAASGVSAGNIAAVLSASGISPGAISARVMSSGVSTFNPLTIAVAVSGNYDKTGYSLSVTPPTAAQIAAAVISSGVALTINIPTANQNAAVAIASGISTFNPAQTAVMVSGLTDYVLNQIVNAISASGLGGGGGGVGEPIAEYLQQLLLYRR